LFPYPHTFAPHALVTSYRARLRTHACLYRIHITRLPRIYHAPLRLQLIATHVAFILHTVTFADAFAPFYFSSACPYYLQFWLPLRFTHTHTRSDLGFTCPHGLYGSARMQVALLRYFTHILLPYGWLHVCLHTVGLLRFGWFGFAIRGYLVWLLALQYLLRLPHHTFTWLVTPLWFTVTVPHWVLHTHTHARLPTLHLWVLRLRTVLWFIWLYRLGYFYTLYRIAMRTFAFAELLLLVAAHFTATFYRFPTLRLYLVATVTPFFYACHLLYAIYTTRTPLHTRSFTRFGSTLVTAIHTRSVGWLVTPHAPHLVCHHTPPMPLRLAGSLYADSLPHYRLHTFFRFRQNRHVPFTHYTRLLCRFEPLPLRFCPTYLVTRLFPTRLRTVGSHTVLVGLHFVALHSSYTHTVRLVAQLHGCLLRVTLPYCLSHIHAPWFTHHIPPRARAAGSRVYAGSGFVTCSSVYTRLVHCCFTHAVGSTFAFTHTAPHHTGWITRLLHMYILHTWLCSTTYHLVLQFFLGPLLLSTTPAPHVRFTVLHGLHALRSTCPAAPLRAHTPRRSAATRWFTHQPRSTTLRCCCLHARFFTHTHRFAWFWFHHPWFVGLRCPNTVHALRYARLPALPYAVLATAALVGYIPGLRLLYTRCGAVPTPRLRFTQHTLCGLPTLVLGSPHHRYTFAARSRFTYAVVLATHDLHVTPWFGSFLLPGWLVPTHVPRLRLLQFCPHGYAVTRTRFPCVALCHVYRVPGLPLDWFCLGFIHTFCLTHSVRLYAALPAFLRWFILF